MRVDHLFDTVEWKETGAEPGGDLPYATHTGTLSISNATLDAIRLNDGRRIITEESLNRFCDVLVGEE